MEQQGSVEELFTVKVVNGKATIYTNLVTSVAFQFSVALNISQRRYHLVPDQPEQPCFYLRDGPGIASGSCGDCLVG